MRRRGLAVCLVALSVWGVSEAVPARAGWRDPVCEIDGGDAVATAACTPPSRRAQPRPSANSCAGAAYCEMTYRELDAAGFPSAGLGLDDVEAASDLRMSSDPVAGRTARVRRMDQLLQLSRQEVQRHREGQRPLRVALPQVPRLRGRRSQGRHPRHGVPVSIREQRPVRQVGAKRRTDPQPIPCSATRPHSTRLSVGPYERQLHGVRARLPGELLPGPVATRSVGGLQAPLPSLSKRVRGARRPELRRIEPAVDHEDRGLHPPLDRRASAASSRNGTGAPTTGVRPASTWCTTRDRAGRLGAGRLGAGRLGAERLGARPASSGGGSISAAARGLLLAVTLALATTVVACTSSPAPRGGVGASDAGGGRGNARD